MDRTGWRVRSWLRRVLPRPGRRPIAAAAALSRTRFLTPLDALARATPPAAANDNRRDRAARRPPLAVVR